MVGGRDHYRDVVNACCRWSGPATRCCECVLSVVGSGDQHPILGKSDFSRLPNQPRDECGTLNGLFSVCERVVQCLRTSRSMFGAGLFNVWCGLVQCLVRACSMLVDHLDYVLFVPYNV